MFGRPAQSLIADFMAAKVTSPETYNIELYVTADDPKQYYHDLTPSQRLLLLYMYMSDGNSLHIHSYATFFGVSDNQVYRTIRNLSPMVSVVSFDRAGWMLMKHAKKRGYEPSEGS